MMGEGEEEEEGGMKVEGINIVNVKEEDLKEEGRKEGDLKVKMN